MTVKDVLVHVFYVSMIGLSLFWGINQKIEKNKIEVMSSNLEIANTSYTADLHQKITELEETKIGLKKAIDDCNESWGAAFKSASERAAMWLEKLKEEKAKNEAIMKQLEDLKKQ